MVKISPTVLQTHHLRFRLNFLRNQLPPVLQGRWVNACCLRCRNGNFSIQVCEHLRRHDLCIGQNGRDVDPIAGFKGNGESYASGPLGNRLVVDIHHAGAAIIIDVGDMVTCDWNYNRGEMDSGLTIGFPHGRQRRLFPYGDDKVAATGARSLPTQAGYWYFGDDAEFPLRVEADTSTPYQLLYSSLFAPTTRCYRLLIGVPPT